MTRALTFTEGGVYHLYNRGVDKRLTFTSKGEYERFISLLYCANSTSPTDLKMQGKRIPEVFSVPVTETLCDILCYSVMPNHYHLLVHEKSPGGISKLMQKLGTGYTMYFNKKHERTGALFQGVFKCRAVEDEGYLNCLISYIHLNPLSLSLPNWKTEPTLELKQVNEILDRYPYSSYIDLSSTLDRPNMKILAREQLSALAPAAMRSVKEHVAQWLAARHEMGNDILSLQGETL